MRIRSKNLGVYPQTYIKGFDIVLSNLNREIANIKGTTTKGLVLASELVRHNTEHKGTVTPEDIGNLIASWFVVSTKEIVPDKLGRSGIFKNASGPEGKSENRASNMTAQHRAAIANAQSILAATKEPGVIMGYSASYAAPVHEMEKRYKTVNWKRPGSGGEWFKKAIEENKKNIIEIIKENSRLK